MIELADYVEAIHSPRFARDPIPVRPHENPLGYLLDWFNGLSRQRDRGWGPGALQFSEIYAYDQLHKLRMSSWEVDALIEFDDRIRVALSKRKEILEDGGS